MIPPSSPTFPTVQGGKWSPSLDRLAEDALPRKEEEEERKVTNWLSGRKPLPVAPVVNSRSFLHKSYFPNMKLPPETAKKTPKIYGGDVGTAIDPLPSAKKADETKRSARSARDFAALMPTSSDVDSVIFGAGRRVGRTRGSFSGSMVSAMSNYSKFSRQSERLMWPLKGTALLRSTKFHFFFFL